MVSYYPLFVCMTHDSTFLKHGKFINLTPSHFSVSVVRLIFLCLYRLVLKFIISPRQPSPRWVWWAFKNKIDVFHKQTKLCNCACSIYDCIKKMVSFYNERELARQCPVHLYTAHYFIYSTHVIISSMFNLTPFDWFEAFFGRHLSTIRAHLTSFSSIIQIVCVQNRAHCI